MDFNQELGDTDPLTLAQVHEHLVRSPPPAFWPHTPAFSFNTTPMSSPSNSDAMTQRYNTTNSPSNTGYCRDGTTDITELSRSEPSSDVRGGEFFFLFFRYVYINLFSSIKLFASILFNTLYIFIYIFFFITCIFCRSIYAFFTSQSRANSNTLWGTTSAQIGRWQCTTNVVRLELICLFINLFLKIY